MDLKGDGCGFRLHQFQAEPVGGSDLVDRHQTEPPSPMSLSIARASLSEFASPYSTRDSAFETLLPRSSLCSAGVPFAEWTYPSRVLALFFSTITRSTDSPHASVNFAWSYRGLSAAKTSPS